MNFLDKKTIDKLSELEDSYFDDSIRQNDIACAWSEQWRGKVGAEISWEDYHAGWLERQPLPFFNISCCAKMVEQKTVITDDGLCTMTWRLEWDAEAASIFRAGVEWAIANGLEVPDGILEAIS